jgi:hypothetical protein
VLLLALAIISTVAAVSAALSALGLLPQRQRAAGPQTVVIVVTRIEATAAVRQPDRLPEGLPCERDNLKASLTAGSSGRTT